MRSHIVGCLVEKAGNSLPMKGKPRYIQPYESPPAAEGLKLGYPTNSIVEKLNVAFAEISAQLPTSLQRDSSCLRAALHPQHYPCPV